MTAAESVSEEAVEAAADAIWAHEGYTRPRADCMRDPNYDGWANGYPETARVALAAAVPHLERRIRESIAGEIEAAHGNFSRESCQAFGGYSVGHFDGLDGAARIARGSSS